jgi:hypothetical protein
LAPLTFEPRPATVGGAVTQPEPGGPVRLAYHLGAGPAPRAAGWRLDRLLGAALALRAVVRGGGQKVWLRAAVIDGNGERSLQTLFDGVLTGDWREVQARLPDGLKPPLTWQSVYVAAADGDQAADGAVEVRELAVLRVE